MEYPFCAVHHLACTVQPRGHAEIGQVFTFARDGVVEYCASQNDTPVGIYILLVILLFKID